LGGGHPGVADLRFYLCPDDARVLMNSPDVDRLRRGRALLTEDYANQQDRHRRTHALLGQSYLRHVFCAQHLEVCFGMRVVGNWNIQSDWVARIQRRVIRIPEANLPGHENFDDLEDDHDEDLSHWDDNETWIS